MTENIFRRHPHGIFRRQLEPFGRQFGTACLGRGVIQGHKQSRRRQFAAPIDPDIGQILGIEFKIKPGPAIRDDPRGMKVLARGMGFALVVVEENTGRTVHLADDDAFGTVDNKSTIRGHERHVAHVNVLFLDIADRAGAGFFIDIPDDQAQRHFKRRAIGHAALLAFLDIIFRRFKLVADIFKL